MFDFVSFIPRAVVQGIPLLFGSTGETLTEKSGNLNLGIARHHVCRRHLRRHRGVSCMSRASAGPRG